VDPVRTTVVALACVLVALAGGLYLGGHPSLLPDDIRKAFVKDENAVRDQLIDAIQDGYYKKTSRKQLEQASLKGVVSSLKDPFSHYLSPAEAKLFHESLDPAFEGVGMSVAEDKRGLRVVKVFDDSPAKKVGIGPDDVGRMIKHNGVPLAYVRLAAFDSGAHAAVEEQLGPLLKKGARGIVLDLRGNPGGLLTEAVLTSSLFIEKGTIVSTSGRTQPKHVFSAEGDTIAPRQPMVVLVDKGSASSSEIVTGALRDRGRATVIGQKTFGKGVFQNLEELQNGGVLDLTVGSYYLPSGENLAHKGIEPTVPARDLPKTRRDEALPIALDVLVAKVR
jgi:carboxyl-terminal processing protease